MARRPLAGQLSPCHLHLQLRMRFPRCPQHRCLPHHSNRPCAGRTPRVQQPAHSLTLPRRGLARSRSLPTLLPGLRQTRPLLGDVAAEAGEGVAADGTSQSPRRRPCRLAVLLPTCSPTPRIGRPGRSGAQQPLRRLFRQAWFRLMPYPLRTRSANACIPSKAYLQNCGAPSVPLCEPDSGLLRRVPPLKRNSGVGNCSCWPRACSCIGSRAMHASPPKSSTAAAISLCGGCGHSCSTKPHKLPAHPSPPPGLRRPRMLGGLPAPLP